MPSPFPGMDPWLEQPAVWPDFHDRLAEEISAALNQSLPPPYYAQLGVREELGILGNAVTHRIVPDVSVQSTGDGNFPDAARAAVVSVPRTELTESIDISMYNEPDEVSFVEIRDARTGHEVVTLMEILSPSNKYPGKDQDAYLRKRDEVLAGTASLIEIDLLRSGERRLFGTQVFERLCQVCPPLDYVVLVQRAWKRRGPIGFQLFPARLTQALPVIAIPLRQGEPEASLDLQYAFQQTYDRGPYRRGAVDYNQPLHFPLAREEQSWADQLLAASGARSPSAARLAGGHKH